MKLKQDQDLLLVKNWINSMQKNINKKQTSFSFLNNIFKKLNIDEKNQKLVLQIFKFIVVGGIATIIDWIIYFVLYNYLNVNPLISNIISFSISMFYNYYASVKWVFNVKAGKSRLQQFVEFIVFSLFGLLITEIILFIGVSKLGMNAMAIKIIATAITMVFNFVTRKLFLE